VFKLTEIGSFCKYDKTYKIFDVYNEDIYEISFHSPELIEYFLDKEKLVIKNEIKGFKFVDQDGELVILEVGAGENLDDIIALTVIRNLGGLENLSGIPGTVGGAAGSAGGTPLPAVGAAGAAGGGSAHPGPAGQQRLLGPECADAVAGPLQQRLYGTAPLLLATAESHLGGDRD
jgi:hypothetical protein